MPKRSIEAPASKDNPKTRRCRNCPKMFTTIRDYQRFCSASCRKQFFEYNNTGYGRVKYIVDKRMRQMENQIAEIEQTLTSLWEEMRRIGE